MKEIPLRAFLMMRASDGDWTVAVCRDLGAIMREWKSRSEPKKQVAVLHVGFDRPPSQVFEELANKHMGRMLLTEAAKHCLPSSFVSSNSPIGTVEECAVFIGLRGWGYFLDDPTVSKQHSESTGNAVSSSELNGWLAWFAKENPSAKEILLAKGICDEQTYMKNESSLDRNIRHQLGLFRTYSLVGSDCTDPCELAHSTPPWLAERELIALEKMTVRAGNVFRKNGIKTVQDLAKWSSSKLLDLENFGVKSLQDIIEALNASLVKGPIYPLDYNEDIGSNQLSMDANRYSTPLSNSESSVSTWHAQFERVPQQSSKVIQEISSVRGHGKWFTSFLEENSSYKEILLAEGISDEQTYMRNESSLDRVIRHKLGMFRAHYLVGRNCDDPCELARVAPPWLAERELLTLEKMSDRAGNILVENGIKTVQDLVKWSSDKLLDLENLGVQSLQDVLKALNAALIKGPIYFVNYVEIPESKRLLTEVRQSLLSFPKRERDILTQRLGFETDSKTLQELADEYRLTRERIRQIERSATEKWIRISYWDDVLEQRITQLIIGRNFPLPVAGVEAIDHWFEGVSSHMEFFRKLVQAVCKDRVHIIEIEGIYYFSLMDQIFWNRTVSEAISLLSSGTNQKWDESYARSLVNGLLPDNAKEFEQLLWDKSSKLCHFKSNVEGSRILIGYGRGTEQIVEAILTESESPLHYKEIAEHLHKQGKHLDPKRVHAIAMDVGFLFAPGTYGLASHLPLSQEQVLHILCLAEDIVCFESSGGRQWHTSEILSELSDRLDDGDFEELDKYMLNIILSKSTLLKSLKRMTWVIAGEDTDEKTRIDIHQAVISIVKEAGRPLTRNEIKERLLAVRGVGDFFQVKLVDPLIRIRTGVWGINDRDVPLSRLEQQELLNKLAIKLDKRESGIHAEELSHLLDLRNCPSGAFFSIAIQDGRFNVKRQYIYLAEWEGPRRETIQEAVLGILKALTQRVSLDEIALLVEQRIGWKCKRINIYDSLRTLGANFDRKTGTWHLSTISEAEIE